MGADSAETVALHRLLPELDAPGAKASPLASPTATRTVLDSFGLSTKYSYGQNFLINDDVIAKIVALADVASDDVVLEVGPGIGTLTYALLTHARSVVSVERDGDLPPVLAATLARFDGAFKLLEKDALGLTVGDLRQALGDGSPLPNMLVSNLPYEVAATIVLDYFQRFESLESATVMVQREVADRMAAKPGTKQYGAYTVKLALYARPGARFNVGPGNFFPPPRVESTVQRLDRCVATDDSGNPASASELHAACLMADAAFANRRKTIANSCRTFFAGRGDQATVQVLATLFDMAGIAPTVRGEALTPADYIRLGKAYLTVVAHD